MKPTPSILLTLAALLGSGPLQAQQQRTVPTPQEFLTTQDDSLFSLPRSQEDVHQWEQARTDLEQGAFDQAVERLHRALQQEIGGMAAIAPNRFIALRHGLILQLANLPEPARAAYEELVRREAGALYGRDPISLREPELERLATRFPASSIGRKARLRLGDLALERGAGLQAQTHFDLLLQAVAIGSDDERRAFQRLQTADALVRARSLRLQGSAPAAAREALDVLPAAADRTDWPALGGGEDGATPMAEPVGRPVAQFADAIQAPGFDYGGGASYAMHASGSLDGLFVCTGLETLAIDPLRGELQWASFSPMREQADARAMRDYGNSINPNMALCPAVQGDVVVAALQVPDQTAVVRYQNALTIMHRIPERRLFAFQRSTGKLLWSHFDRVDGPVTERFSGHASCGPPLILGDTVYAPVHDRSGAIAFYVGAYDLRTGQPRWRRLVCSSQQEVNMFGNARQEFAASPLCSSNGLVLGASNLGVAFAIEQASGRLRWITAYDVIRMPPTQMQGQDARVVFFQNSPPCVTDGVVCLTPLDSAAALGLDAMTGELLWKLPHQARANGNNDVRWLCGALGDEFVLHGRGTVAVQARPNGAPNQAAAVRQLRAPSPLLDQDQDEFPRPAVTADRIYVPGAQGVVVLDKDGGAAPAALQFQAQGNLLLIDGMAVSLRHRALEVHYDPMALRQLAERRLQNDPDDPAAILRLCTLEAAAKGPAAADLAGLYRRGIAACRKQGLAPDHPLHQTFLLRLFEAALARAEESAGAQALGLLEEARDLAPDVLAFLRAQSLRIERAMDAPEDLRAQLRILEARAAGQTFALPRAGGPTPVEAYVAWRRALLAQEPQAAVQAWQALLQRHGDVAIAGSTAYQLAHAAIAARIATDGKQVYGPIEAEAARRLAQAGSDLAALRALRAEFPHSDAATAAERLLLDAAVAAGDLGAAVDLLRTARRDSRSPAGVLRRVQIAAKKAGNLALARRCADELAASDGASDWPEDAGASWRDVAAALLPQLEAELAAAAASANGARPAPTRSIAAIENPAPPAALRPLLTTAAPGFVPWPEALLMLSLDDEVRAVRITDTGSEARFAHRGTVVDRVWLAGRRALMADLESIVAIDLESGLVAWNFERPQSLIVVHGVMSGVLLLTERDDNDRVLCLGLEPHSGALLWQRELPPDRYSAQLRPTPHGLLVLRARPDGPPEVERIDPFSGTALGRTPLRDEAVASSGAKPEVLRSPLLLQRFFADEGRIYVPLDGPLCSSGAPQLLALEADGTVAWQWHGEPGQSLTAEYLGQGAARGRICVVASGGGQRPRSRALVLDAATGAIQKTVELGADVRPLNWRRQRSLSGAPERLLLSDLSPQNGDLRLCCVPLADGESAFAQSVGASNDEVLLTPWCDDQNLVFATRSRRSTGPVRLHALRRPGLQSALPDGKASHFVPTPPRSSYELCGASAYTALVTDSMVFLFGGDSQR